MIRRITCIGAILLIAALVFTFIQCGTAEVSAQGGEVTSMRTRTSKTHYLGGTGYSLDVSLGSVHYQDGVGDWQEIDNSWVAATAPWDWEMTEDGYQTRVLEDFTAGQVLLFESEGESVAFQPMALEWTNDLGQIDQISMPQDVTVSVTNEAVELVPGMSGGVGTIEWVDGYGSGRDFRWSATPGRLSKELVLDAIPPAPPQYIIDGGNPVLRLNFIFDPSGDLDIYVDGGLWDGSSHVQTVSQIEFHSAGEVLWGFAPAIYWDSGNLTGVAITELDKKGNSLYVSTRVPYGWLQDASYPVFIDPTIEEVIGAETDDCRLYYTTVPSGMWVWSTSTSRQDVGQLSTTADKVGGGMRFQTVALDQGTTIDTAYLIIEAQDTDSGNTVKSYIEGEDVDDAATFSTEANYNARTHTSATVAWDSIGSWTDGTDYNSPEIKTIVQEVVNRSGWSSGNDMVIFWDDHDDRSSGSSAHRVGVAYGAAGTKQRLHIEYTAGCSPDISLDVSSWSVNSGTPVAVSSTYETGLTNFEVTNNSGGAVDITIHGHDMTGGTAWDLADSGSPSSDVYGMYAGLSGGSYNIIVRETATFNDLVTGLADSGTQDFGLKIYIPTSFSDAVAKEGAMTLTAACSA